MAVTQYIGARYVPIFADPAEWSSTKQYEPLTIVLHEGNSFTSKQFVPVGVDIDDTDYWAETGNYNAQVEQYREEVNRFADSIQERAFAFDTVADMQGSDSLYVGAICHTNGFHSNGDGGAAWYVISATGTANDMDVISCGSLYAVLCTSTFVTAEMFGAYGNATHDDTSNIQAALDCGLPVHLQAKSYCVSKLTFSDNSKLIGANTTIGAATPSRTVIMAMRNGDYLIECGNASQVFNVELRNVVLYANNKAIKGMSICASRSLFDNITCLEFNSNCIEMHDTWECDFGSLGFYLNTNGVSIYIKESVLSGGNISNVHFDKIQFEANPQELIYMSGSANATEIFINEIEGEFTGPSTYVIEKDSLITLFSQGVICIGRIFVSYFGARFYGGVKFNNLITLNNGVTIEKIESIQMPACNVLKINDGGSQSKISVGEIYYTSPNNTYNGQIVSGSTRGMLHISTIIGNKSRFNEMLYSGFRKPQEILAPNRISTGCKTVGIPYNGCWTGVEIDNTAEVRFMGGIADRKFVLYNSGNEASIKTYVPNVGENTIQVPNGISLLSVNSSVANFGQICNLTTGTSGIYILGIQ